MANNRSLLAFIAVAAALLMPGCANHRYKLPGFSVKPASPGGVFEAGAAREELTPPAGYPNAGHGPPAAIARGYWSRLYARAFYFRDPDGHVAVLVSCDLFAMSGGLWHAVLAKVNGSGVRLPPESLVLAATHTHQGPGGFMTASGYNVLAAPLPGFDKTLFNTLVDRIASAVVSAAHNAVPARLALRKGRAEIQRNRAIVPFFENGNAAAIMCDSGVACPADNNLCARLKAVDPTLFTLEATNAATAEPIGLLVFYAVHPTALRHDAPLMSADLAGRAMSRLEPDPFQLEPNPQSQKLWPVAGFFNGAEGDVSPEWKDQSRNDVIELGDRLAQSVRDLATSPNLAKDLVISPKHLEFANNWRHEQPNLTAKLATHPTPGAALFGGAEDGRAGILYQQDWHGGIRSKIPGCKTALDQGCKVSAIDYPLHEFLKLYGLPTWANTLPMKLHLTSIAAAHGFPNRLPIGWIRFGDWLSLAALPVEMTTAMARTLREANSGKNVVIVGLANEYFSYTTTPEEYDKQQYEGASTLGGPQEGPALIDMLKEVDDCEDDKCHQMGLPPETYRVGPYPAKPFGPRLLKPPRNMVDEDMDAFALPSLAYSETQVPRAEWFESPDTDWLARDRSVRIWRLDGAFSTLFEDEGSWRILTVLAEAQEKPVPLRRWDALWMLRPDTPRDADFYFQVHIPGRGDLCSGIFRLNSTVDHVPVSATEVNRPCPAGLRK